LPVYANGSPRMTYERNGVELKATEANCRGYRSGSCERGQIAFQVMPVSSLCGSTRRVIRKTAAASQRSVANSWAISVPRRSGSGSFVVFPSLILNYNGQAAVACRPNVISAASKLIQHPLSASAKPAIGRQVGRDVELWRGLGSYAALKSQRREAFWPLLSVLTSATDESPNSERHVAEQHGKVMLRYPLLDKFNPQCPQD
jgi:hypothetical protein